MTTAELIETARVVASARLGQGDSYVASLMVQLADALERADAKIQSVRVIAEPEMGHGYTLSADGIMRLLSD